MEAAAFMPTGSLTTLYKQCNYTNLCLQTIGKQLIRINEDKIDELKDKVKDSVIKGKVINTEEINPANIKPPIKVTEKFFNLNKKIR